MATNIKPLLLLLVLSFSLLVSSQGTQFITGACKSDADCASGCCGFRSGKCAGPIIAQQRDGGCGFGNAQPNDYAARIFRGQAPVTSSVPAAGQASSGSSDGTSAAGGTDARNAQSSGITAGNGSGKQFITGVCSSDADCASACCGFKSGKCAGAIIAQERDGGCGFGNATPNDNAARVLRGQAPATGGDATPATTMITMAAVGGAAGVAALPQATPVASSSGSGGNGAGNAQGKQFITGACSSDADCASKCCGFKSGKCAGPIIAQERDGGCGFGNAQPNDIAAQALRSAKREHRRALKYWA